MGVFLWGRLTDEAALADHYLLQEQEAGGGQSEGGGGGLLWDEESRLRQAVCALGYRLWLARLATQHLILLQTRPPPPPPPPDATR